MAAKSKFNSMLVVAKIEKSKEKSCYDGMIDRSVRNALVVLSPHLETISNHETRRILVDIQSRLYSVKIDTSKSEINSIFQILINVIKREDVPIAVKKSLLFHTKTCLKFGTFNTDVHPPKYETVYSFTEKQRSTIDTLYEQVSSI